MVATSDTLAATEKTIRSSEMPPAKRAETTPKTKSPAKKVADAKTTKTATAARTKATATKTTGSRATAKAAKPAATRAGRASSTASARRTASSSASKRTDGARAAAARVKRAASSDGGVISIAEQLVKGAVSPKDVVLLTREHIQETLDDAASRGRVTRKDANELVAELVRRGRSGGDDVVSELEGLLGKGRGQIESATKRAARSQPVDRIVRGADRARRAAGVGSSFPISGYPDLNVSQVQARLKELSKPELRKVLTYERKNANRKSVVGAIEKSL
jgi:polyhydroxyalkanoate synthesis regulator phasin